MAHGFEDPCGQIVIFLLFLPFNILAGIMFLPVIGLVLFPLAGLIGLLIARRKLTDSKYMVTMSMFYSLISVLLWIYFILRALGKNISDGWVAVAHVHAYFVWLFMLWSALDRFDSRYYESTPVLSAIATTLIWIGSATLILSLTTFKFGHDPLRRIVIAVDRLACSGNTTEWRGGLSLITRSIITLPVAPFVFSVLWSLVSLIDDQTLNDFWMNSWVALVLACSVLWILWYCKETLTRFHQRRKSKNAS